jgi:hypothetical protein
MAVVAGVALGLGVWNLMLESKRRAHERFQRALYHAARRASSGTKEPFELRPRVRIYHTQMMRKWLEASKHPWSRVQPDPPEPPD